MWQIPTISAIFCISEAESWFSIWKFQWRQCDRLVLEPHTRILTPEACHLNSFLTINWLECFQHTRTVDFIYEPTQEGTQKSFFLLENKTEAESVDIIATHLGYQKVHTPPILVWVAYVVCIIEHLTLTHLTLTIPLLQVGWVFSHAPEGRDYIMSPSEVQLATQYQAEAIKQYPNEGKYFVTIKVTGSKLHIIPSNKHI